MSALTNTGAVHSGLTDEIETNAKGGKQSKLGVRFDLLPPYAAAAVANVNYEGAIKYTPWNWLKIDARSHLNHAIAHLYGDNGKPGFLELDRDDRRDLAREELKHAACRVMMALDVFIREDINEKYFGPFREDYDAANNAGFGPLLHYMAKREAEKLNAAQAGSADVAADQEGVAGQATARPRRKPGQGQHAGRGVQRRSRKRVD